MRESALLDDGANLACSIVLVSFLWLLASPLLGPACYRCAEKCSPSCAPQSCTALLLALQVARPDNMINSPSDHAFLPDLLPFTVWPGHGTAQRCVATAGSDQLQASRDHLPLSGALASTPEVDAQTGKAGGSKPRVLGGREGGGVVAPHAWPGMTLSRSAAQCMWPPCCISSVLLRCLTVLLSVIAATAGSGCRLVW